MTGRRRLWVIVLTLAIMTGQSGVALAAKGVSAKPSEAVFVAQIILLLAAGRLLGEIMQRLGQPAVMGQLIAGILLGPSVFGAISPTLFHAAFPNNAEQKAMTDAVGELGILMLLLLTGMETDLAIVRKAKWAAFNVSVSGIIVPFALGLSLGLFIPDTMLPDPEKRFVASLFLGTVLSISSVKIVAMVVREVGFMRRTIGQIIVASAIIDDTIGWTIIAIISGLATHGAVDLFTVGKTVIGSVLFVAISFTFGRHAAFLVIRWANDNFVMELPVISMILVVMGVMALITEAIGVNMVLGAFVAGILIGQSPILTKHIAEQVRGLIVALFMPVFFGLAGQNADLRVLGDGSHLFLLFEMIVIASIGKFSGAFVGCKLSGMTAGESLALGCGMNARGSTEIIVATLGLTIGVLNNALFTTIIVMAVVTTMAMPPMLRWSLARLPISPEEKQRLEREDMEARGFVTNFERLLVAVDQSASGQLASRFVGLFAGVRRTPITVLPVAEIREPKRERSGLATFATASESDDEQRDAGKSKAVIKAVGDQVDAGPPDAGKAAPLDVVTRQQKEPIEGAVTKEAKKGYDCLVIGVEPTLTDHRFSERVERMAEGFGGPVALVLARGAHRDNPNVVNHDILVPITGTDYSRHGAEIAFTLARASNATVTAMYVAANSGSRSWRQPLRRHPRMNESPEVAHLAI